MEILDDFSEEINIKNNLNDINMKENNELEKTNMDINISDNYNQYLDKLTKDYSSNKDGNFDID